MYRNLGLVYMMLIWSLACSNHQQSLDKVLAFKFPSLRNAMRPLHAQNIYNGWKNYIHVCIPYVYISTFTYIASYAFSCAITGWVKLIIEGVRNCCI